MNGLECCSDSFVLRTNPLQVLHFYQLCFLQPRPDLCIHNPDEFVITVEYWPSPPPPPPPKKKGPVFKRAHRRNHERSCVSCVPYFKLLLECQFFPEMFKRVRGSFNDYVDIRLLNTGHFFLWGGWGGGYIAVL